MKKFLSENSKTITKLLLNRFGSIVFALMLALATVTSDSDTVFVLGSVVSVIFYCYLIYLTVWERGASDRIRADGGRIEAEPHKGVKIALAAAFPGFVLAVFIFLGAIIESAGAEVPFLSSLSSVCEIIGRIWQAMYIGIIQTVTPSELSAVGRVLYSLLYLVVILPEILVTWASYYLGYNGKLMSRAYKKSKKDLE